jgi:hypothetical protein
MTPSVVDGFGDVMTAAVKRPTRKLQRDAA